MQATAYNFLVACLYEWGVWHVLSYPGDGINDMSGALQRADGKIKFIQVRHEEMATFMAPAYAKFIGELGVCMATSGPGAAYLITGLCDTQLGHMPVLAITGQQVRTAVGGHYQQEVDLVAMFRDMAGAFIHQVSIPAQMRYPLDHAVRIIIGQCRMTALVLPNDLQEIPYTEPSYAHDTVYSDTGYSAPSVIPQIADLECATDILNNGRRVAMLVGAGTLGVSVEVATATETLGVDVAKVLLGRTMLPDDLPYATGTIGLLGTEPSWELTDHYDTLLMVGSGFPYAEFLPEEDQARGVQIDLDPGMLGLCYPMEIDLVGDSVQTLRVLLLLLQRKTDPYWPNRIACWNGSWWKTLGNRMLQSAYPVNLQRVFWELSPRLPDDVIVASDSDTYASWCVYDFRFKPGMMGSLSGGLASMGAAVPYAIVARFAHPERPVIILMGDGAMQMDNMAELITVSKYWKHWKSSKWICMVLNNQSLSEVTWEQHVMEGDSKFPAAQDIPNVPYHRLAELIGLKSIYVDNPDRLADARDEALNTDRPVVLEVEIGPDVPPPPPHITLQQAHNFAAALAYGDPDAGDVLRGTARQVLPALFPVHKEQVHRCNAPAHAVVCRGVSTCR